MSIKARVPRHEPAGEVRPPEARARKRFMQTLHGRSEPLSGRGSERVRSRRGSAA